MIKLEASVLEAEITDHCMIRVCLRVGGVESGLAPRDFLPPITFRRINFSNPSQHETDKNKSSNTTTSSTSTSLSQRFSETPTLQQIGSE
ncbi:hypothetical protein J6590_042575 [Homalodisca vitripennis]|nr:hypothetical protein J6590_042575 [Homalodisca vitripennis]